MSKANSTTRESRATALLTSGKVQLFVGKGYAVVAGSRGGEYTVTSNGCTCKDAETRGRTGCYHALAVRQLCEEYRALKAQAERGETVSPSVALLQAIRWPERATTSPTVETPAPALTCQDCGVSIRVGKWCKACLDAALFGTAA